MPYYPKEGQGKMWSNANRKTHDRQPDYTGVLNLAGDRYRIAAWHNPPTEREPRGIYSIRLAPHDGCEEPVEAGAGMQTRLDADNPF